MLNREKLPGLIYDFRENIARLKGGDWSQEITEIINEPSDDRFEGHIAFMRAARGFGGIGDNLSSGNAKCSSRCMYCRIFLGVLSCIGLFCFLLSAVERIHLSIKKSIDSAFKLRCE